MNSSYLNKKREVVDQMIKKESTFLHESGQVELLSDVAFYKPSIAFDSASCIYDLVCLKKSVNGYQLKDDLDVTFKKQMPVDISSLIADFSAPEDKIIRNANGCQRVNTTVLVVESMDLHVWKEKYDQEYKNKGIKVAFADKRKIGKYMANNFRKSNNLDMLVVTANVWNRMLTEDGYRGYDSDVNFCFDRVIFALDFTITMNGNVNLSVKVPVANFTWFRLNNLKERIVRPEDRVGGNWDDTLPVCTRREDLPWTRDFDADLKDALTVDASSQYDGKLCVNSNKITQIKNGHIQFTNVGDYVKGILAKDPTKRIMVLNDSVINNCPAIVRSLRKNNISFCNVTKTRRINRQKLKDSGKSVILVNYDDVMRKDLDLDFIDELVVLNSWLYCTRVSVFIQKLCPFDKNYRRYDCKLLNVTMVGDYRTQHSLIVNQLREVNITCPTSEIL